MVAMNLARELKAKRGAMTLREAHKESGIHYATLLRMERGQRSTLENVIRALQWLEVPNASWSAFMPKMTSGKKRSAK